MVAVALVPAPGLPERAVHALNRLAYGPSPGDLEAVERMGLKGWINRQLDPASVPDGEVEAKLQSYRTPAMSTPELVAAFPLPEERAKEMGVDLSEPGAMESFGAMIPPGELPLEIGLQLFSAKLVRAVESRRQFAEVCRHPRRARPPGRSRLENTSVSVRSASRVESGSVVCESASERLSPAAPADLLEA